MKVPRVLGAALVLVSALGYARASGQSTSVASVLSCEDLTLARPHQGVEYRGSVQNSDYRFTAKIPPPYTGWGAAPVAPFHGFAVFLTDNPPSAQPSCIVFEIHHRVQLPEDENAGLASTRTAEWQPWKIGNRNGFQKIREGSLNGVSFENITLSLELPREGYANDLTITFITPLRDRARTKPIFRSFVSSFRFW